MIHHDTPWYTIIIYYHILSYIIISYHILSYLIIYYHILSSPSLTPLSSHHHSNQGFNMQLDYPSRSFHSFGTDHLNFVAMRRLLLRWPPLKWRRGAWWAFRLAFGRENRVIVNLSMPAGCTRALHRLIHADTESQEMTFLLQKVSNFRRHQDNPRWCRNAVGRCFIRNRGCDSTIPRRLPLAAMALLTMRPISPFVSVSRGQGRGSPNKLLNIAAIKCRIPFQIWHPLWNA